MNLSKRKKNVIGIFVFLTLLLIGVVIVNLNRDEEPYWYQNFGRNISLAYLKSGKKAIYKNRIRISPYFDWVNTPSFNSESPFLVFSQNNLRGYFNINSKKVEIEARFKHAWIFDELYNLAAVQEENSDLIGFISENGVYQISPRYPHKRNIYNEHHFVFDGKTAIVPLSNTTLELGLIDSSGFILSRGFDDIKAVKFNHRVVSSKGKKGLVNDEGTVVIPTEYDSLSCNSSGIVARNDTQQKLIAYDYKTVLSPYVFDELRPLYNANYNVEFYYDEETTSSYISTRYGIFIINGKLGLLNLKTNKIISDAVWDKLYYIVSDQYIVAEKDQMTFLIDEQGRELKFNQ